jgi:hypothetical protein
LVIIVVTVGAFTGCAHTPPYLCDRGRDAADILTLTAGYGGGGQVQVGPLKTGLFANRDCAGLRGGLLDTYPVPPFGNNGTRSIDALIARTGDFTPPDPVARSRGKGLTTTGVVCLTFVGYPGAALFGGCDPAPYHYSRIEVAAGLGPTVRAGFNPGELLDFLLGLGKVDIYGDDVGRIPPAESKADAKCATQ